MADFRVDPEFEREARPLAQEECENLRQLLLAEGCRDPLVISRGVLLDGHHRYRLCEEHNIGWSVVEIDPVESVGDPDLSWRDASIIWIQKNQRAQRNLNDLQRKLSIGREYNVRKQARRGRPEKFPQGEGIKGATSETLAEEYGLGRATVERYGEFAEAFRDLEEEEPEVAARVVRPESNWRMKDVLDLCSQEDPHLKEEILGELRQSDSTSYKEAKKKARQKEEARKAEEEKLPGSGERHQVIHGLMEEACATLDEGSIDAIITDPPYPKQYIPLYSALAEHASRLLKPGGSCVVMVGQSYLPDLYRALAEHLRYHWTLAYVTPGGQAVQVWPRKVNTFWKPLLWFVKGDYKGKWVGDVTKSNVNDNDKRFHHWGQSESGMFDIVCRLTDPGGLVLDPFAGASTTGIACLRAGRRYIGIECDKEKYWLSCKRLAREDSHSSLDAEIVGQEALFRVAES